MLPRHVQSWKVILLKDAIYITQKVDLVSGELSSSDTLPTNYPNAKSCSYHLGDNTLS